MSLALLPRLATQHTVVEGFHCWGCARRYTRGPVPVGAVVAWQEFLCDRDDCRAMVLSMALTRTPRASDGGET